jgi:mannose-6-phosphate isomerase class I
MDAFGGSPASRTNKVIADMEEKFEKELALHVDLIEIIDGKMTVVGGNFTKELSIHSNIIDANEKKISTLVQSLDKYFSENDNKIETLIETVEIANNNVMDLKTNLTHANERIVILEDKIDGYQYSLKTTASKTL